MVSPCNFPAGAATEARDRGSAWQHRTEALRHACQTSRPQPAPRPRYEARIGVRRGRWRWWISRSGRPHSKSVAYAKRVDCLRNLEYYMAALGISYYLDERTQARLDEAAGEDLT